MPFLQVNHLEKRFGTTQVLNDISFTMEKGQVLVLLGSSGSGKTTLLRCLNFLETANNGQVILNGETLFDAGVRYSEAEIREKRLKFGLVFQNFNLFPQYTALGNVTLAPKLAAKTKGLSSSEKKTVFAEIEQKAMDLLTRVGLQDKAGFYPNALSGGQQQRVAIARALAMQPEILCFDEPTSALDPELTGEVLRVITSLKGGDRTMIVVTHEMNFAREVADKIIFMANGVIEEAGNPEAFFTDPKSEKARAFLAGTR